MITLSGASAILQAQRQLQAASVALDGVLEDTALAYLESLQARMRPITPVVTGRMKAGYYVQNWGGGRIDLLDRMNYAERVTRLPRHAALLALLEHADDDVGALLTDAVARRLTGI